LRLPERRRGTDARQVRPQRRARSAQGGSFSWMSAPWSPPGALWARLERVRAVGVHLSKRADAAARGAIRWSWWLDERRGRRKIGAFVFGGGASSFGGGGLRGDLMELRAPEAASSRFAGGPSATSRICRTAGGVARALADHAISGPTAAARTWWALVHASSTAERPYVTVHAGAPRRWSRPRCSASRGLHGANESRQAWCARQRRHLFLDEIDSLRRARRRSCSASRDRRVRRSAATSRALRRLVIAATNRTGERVREGSFRAD